MPRDGEVRVHAELHYAPPAVEAASKGLRSVDEAPASVSIITREEIRSFGYTTEGQLLGHMVIALRMIGAKLQSIPDFPIELRNLLEHMILSHHGHLEFGSPKLPQFPEALLLHYLDDMDSKMECMRQLLDRDPLLDGHYTGYSSSLERTVLKKAKYLVPNAAAATASGEATASQPSAGLRPCAQTEPDILCPPAPVPSPVA